MSRWKAAPPSYGFYAGPTFNYQSLLAPFPPPPRLQPTSPPPPSIPPDPNRPTLPFELYRTIVNYLATSPNELCALSRVSRAFHAEASRILYHTLNLKRPIELLWKCESFTARPSLALCVKRLSISVTQYTPLDPIAGILAACVKLEALALRGAVWSDYSKVLEAVGSQTITEFVFHARGEPGVVRFLNDGEKSGQIRDLDLIAHPFELDDLLDVGINNLHAFTGWLVSATKICATGRKKVRHLNLLSSDSPEAAAVNISHIGAGVGDELVSLNLRMGMLRNPVEWIVAQSILLSLRSLRFLGVLSLECARNPYFAHLLMNTPYLQTLVLSTGTDDYAKYEERHQRRLVRLMGSACPSLSQVVISLALWRNDWIWTREDEKSWLGMVSREPVDVDQLARLYDGESEGETTGEEEHDDDDHMLVD